MTAALIICFVIAMMLGPLMLMRPNSAQARTARMRKLAQEKNMRVRLGKNPYQQKAGVFAVYFRIFKKRDKGALEFSLFRKSFVHDIHFYQEWEWFKQAGLGLEKAEKLKAILLELNLAVVGVECTKNTVGLYWCERIAGKNNEQALEYLSTVLDSIVDVAA